MRTSITSVIVIGTLTIAATADQPHAGLSPTLIEAVDHRAIVLEGDDNNVGFNRTGLTLTFDLPFDEGFQFAAFVDDEIKLTAVDSEENDLTQLRDSKFGMSALVESISSWEEERAVTRKFNINLASPARSATAFTVSGTIPAQVYASLETIELEIPALPADMPEVILGPNVQASMSTMGDDASVIFTPGSLKDEIESVKLVTPDGTALETTSTMWNDVSVTYFFEGTPPAGTFVKLTIRRGFQTIPMRVTIVEMPLP